MDEIHEHFLWNCSLVNATEHLGWEVNIGSGNRLVPSGNKPLPEPMLTHMISMLPCGIMRSQWVSVTDVFLLQLRVVSWNLDVVVSWNLDVMADAEAEVQPEVLPEPGESRFDLPPNL